MVGCLLFSGIASVGLVGHADNFGFFTDDTRPLFLAGEDCHFDSIPSGYFSRIPGIINFSLIEDADEGVTPYMCGWHSSAYDEDYCQNAI